VPAGLEGGDLTDAVKKAKAGESGRWLMAKIVCECARPTPKLALFLESQWQFVLCFVQWLVRIGNKICNFQSQFPAAANCWSWHGRL
jgi:hypothetical protein